MEFSRLFFILSSLSIHLMVLTAGQPVMLYHDCVGKGNYTTNSAYQTNLNFLLNSIYTNTEINNGFYNFSYGNDPDTVYAIALCRPDVTPETCRASIREATMNLTALCPNFKEAIGGSDNCMVRYTNRSIFNLMEGGPYFWVHSMSNVSDVNGFNQSRMALLDRLREQAAAGDSRYKYATGQLAAPNFQTIYGLVQCTPDLSESECRDCLYNASGLIPQCCEATDGGRVIYPSCNFRYEISRFYETITTATPSPSPPPTGKKSHTAIIVIIPVVSFLVLMVCICITGRRARKQRQKEVEDVYEIENVEALQVDLDTIRTATDNFSEDNKLGQGGFGAVYKGTFPNGQVIAVKRLCRDLRQGEQEFKNEILLVAKLQHRNLVRLLGFCFQGEERLLVYEFLPNSSLDKFIFDPIKRAHMDWTMRYKIIEGIARGLLYLHEGSRLRIIHRDLKASNILLDEELNPKISDFGTGRLFSVDQTQDSTSRIVGTFGYMAPEYITRGHYSVKSDVFSFGVLVLETASGQKNTSLLIGENQEDLLTYTWRNWNEGTALNIIDPTLQVGSRIEMMRCIHIGLLCVQENQVDRPTMTQVVTMLSSHSVTLSAPLKPAFFMYSTNAASPLENGLTNSDESRNKSVQLSKNEVSISELEPR